MWAQPYRKSDVEAGATPLYPMMLESPQLRWAFIRKIYSIIAIQLLATIAVASVVVSVRPISHFFSSTGAGLALYIVLIITPFIGTLWFRNFMILLYYLAHWWLIEFIGLQCCVRCITITRSIQWIIFYLEFSPSLFRLRWAWRVLTPKVSLLLEFFIF